MKTRVKILPQSILIMLGALFGIPLLSSEKFFTFTSNDGIFLTSIAGLSLICIITGLWKIEQYTIKDGKFIKSNFMLLFQRKRELVDLIDIKKKNIDISTLKYQFFLTNKRYYRYQLITLVFSTSKNLKIDERFMPREDFKVLLKSLHKQRKKNSANKN